MLTKSPVSTTPEEKTVLFDNIHFHLNSAAQPRAVISRLLTWNHLDRRVDFLPVLSALKLPVQDEVAVVSDDRPLRVR